MKILTFAITVVILAPIVVALLAWWGGLEIFTAELTRH